MIRQGLAATAEASSQMWRDLREANQDVVTAVKEVTGTQVWRDLREANKEIANDLRQGVLINEIRQAFRGPTSTCEGAPQEAAATGAAEDVRNKDVSRAGVQSGEVMHSKAAMAYWTQPSTAANYVSLVALDSEQEEEVSAAVGNRGSVEGCGAPAGQHDGTEGHEDNYYGRLWDSRCAAAADGSVEGREGQEGSKAAAAGSPEAKKTGGAMRHARKLGGRIAKRGKGHLQQVRDLVQNIQVSVPGSSGAGSTSADNAVGQAADGDSIFEIGDDDDDEEEWTDVGGDGSGPSGDSQGQGAGGSDTEETSTSESAQGVQPTWASEGAPAAGPDQET